MGEAIVHKDGFTYIVGIGGVIIGQGCSKELCQKLADELNSDSIKMEAMIDSGGDLD